MTFPFERTPTCGEEHHLHLVAGPAQNVPLRRPMAETDVTGAIVFSMLTLEAEERA
ncbi:MAG: hypothetical protein KIS68_01665 [Bauldia sp.]|nr:hypothetical protein [Bauldia sp.]